MELEGECEGEEEQTKSNPFSLSKEKPQNQNPKGKKTQEEQHLHEWLVKEQSKYLKEHGAEGMASLDWDQYVKTYYRRGKG